MKLFKGKVATVLILGGLAASLSGGVNASADIVTLCKSIRDADPVAFEQSFGNLGQCVSQFRTFPVESCQMLKEDGLLGLFGYANQGECVTDVMI